MKMLDQIYAEGVSPPPWFPEAKQPTVRRMTVASMRECGYANFDDAVAFLVDNVSTYLYEGTDQEVWGADDFPNVAPPYPKIWLEAARPDRIVSKEYGVINRPMAVDGLSRIGLLLDSYKVSDTLPDESLRVDRLQQFKDQFEEGIAKIRSYGPRADEFYRKICTIIPGGTVILADDVARLSEVAPREFVLDYANLQRLALTIKTIENSTSEDMIKMLEGNDVEWTMKGSIFGQMGKNIIGPMCGFLASIDKHGRFIHTSHNDYLQLGVLHHANIPSDTVFDLVTAFSSKLFPFWLALSFMHCKNVRITTTEPSKGKKHRKRGKTRPALTYRLLEIDPMKKVIDREGSVSHNGMKMALHICRGHFKDYSKGVGLFGRYKGVYWWPDLVRGHSDHGIVAKDYSVNPKSD